MSDNPGGHFQVSVGGSVGGHVVVGHQNQVSGVLPADLAALAAAFDAARAQAAATAASPQQAAEASARLDELHRAATAAKPDLNTFTRVRDWFVTHLPTMAGAVTGLLVHPVVGALVKSAGDAVTEEFHRRFGGARS